MSCFCGKEQCKRNDIMASDKIDFPLLSLPIEVIFRILDELDEFTIIFYVRNVCTQLKTITDAYYEYKVNI